MCKLDNHPLFPGKTMEYEHRVVMAEHLGRQLQAKEVVHHRHKPNSNNLLSNLVLKGSQKEHLQEHKRPCSEETRLRISAAKKGKAVPALLGHKNSLGRKRSPEFKAKVSAGMKRYRQGLKE